MYQDKPYLEERSPSAVCNRQRSEPLELLRQRGLETRLWYSALVPYLYTNDPKYRLLDATVRIICKPMVHHLCLFRRQLCSRSIIVLDRIIKTSKLEISWGLLRQKRRHLSRLNQRFPFCTNPLLRKKPYPCGVNFSKNKEIFLHMLLLEKDKRITLKETFSLKQRKRISSRGVRRKTIGGSFPTQLSEVFLFSISFFIEAKYSL